jgi:hypothetical protein
MYSISQTKKKPESVYTKPEKSVLKCKDRTRTATTYQELWGLRNTSKY